jgi:hypothetical protein
VAQKSRKVGADSKELSGKDFAENWLFTVIIWGE